MRFVCAILFLLVIFVLALLLLLLLLLLLWWDYNCSGCSCWCCCSCCCCRRHCCCISNYNNFCQTFLRPFFYRFSFWFFFSSFFCVHKISDILWYFSTHDFLFNFFFLVNCTFSEFLFFFCFF